MGNVSIVLLPTSIGPEMLQLAACNYDTCERFATSALT